MKFKLIKLIKRKAFWYDLKIINIIIRSINEDLADNLFKFDISIGVKLFFDCFQYHFFSFHFILFNYKGDSKEIRNATHNKIIIESMKNIYNQTQEAFIGQLISAKNRISNLCIIA